MLLRSIVAEIVMLSSTVLWIFSLVDNLRVGVLKRRLFVRKQAGSEAGSFFSRGGLIHRRRSIREQAVDGGFGGDAKGCSFLFAVSPIHGLHHGEGDIGEAGAVVDLHLAQADLLHDGDRKSVVEGT